jgi:uncharacterized membrane protein
MRPSFFRRIAVFPLLILASCQVSNSNSTDELQYGPNRIDSSDPNFAGAYAILQNRCISCHTHSEWSAYNSSALWVSDSHAVIKGDANGSPMIQQIQIGAMPQGGTISPAEVQTLVDWINNIP